MQAKNQEDTKMRRISDERLKAFCEGNEALFKEMKAFLQDKNMTVENIRKECEMRRVLPKWLVERGLVAIYDSLDTREGIAKSIGGAYGKLYEKFLNEPISYFEAEDVIKAFKPMQEYIRRFIDAKYPDGFHMGGSSFKIKPRPNDDKDVRR